MVDENINEGVVKEKNNEGIIEAALFLAGRFMSLQELVMYTGINPITLKDVMRKIEEKHNGPGALKIINKGELYKMDIKEEYVWLTNKLASGSSEFTRAEQETLAIIAYKQPINQSVVVKIRGNKGYDHIRKLIDVGLVRTKRVGHTLELKLDDAFYNYFSIKSKERQANDGGVEDGEGGLEGPRGPQGPSIDMPSEEIDSNPLNGAENPSN
ncbi:MAG: SMC-Scp complex subunit ScpB [Nanoarchaeota archaeon]|nr:SMC-Scp complex subunit ScpB [Nanoarchaeota archaeon]